MPSSEASVEWRPEEKIVVVFFGMTASGKSTLGKAWADQCGVPYYNTDRVRKELAGLSVSARRADGVGQGIYTPAFTAMTYETMLESARADFANGARMVVLDGSYARRADRDQVRAMAAEIGVQTVLIFCVCAEEEVRRRLALRAGDPEAVSDGRWEIYRHQRFTFELPNPSDEQDCLPLNTEQSVASMLQWLTDQASKQG
jgi:predicted kinase